MATLQDLLNSGMSRDEINAILSQSIISTDGFQGNPQPDYRDALDLGAISTGGGLPPQQQTMAQFFANPQPEQLVQQPEAPRFTVGDDGLSRMTDRPGVSDQSPMNSIRNNTTGVVTQMPTSRQGRSHDVWADGPEVLHRQLMPDGRTLVTERVPAMSDGRQSVGIRQRIETPDYLNPAMIQKQKYEKGAAELAQLQAKQIALAEAAGLSTGGQMTAKQYEARHGKIPSGFEIYRTGNGDTDIRPVQGGKQYIELQDRINKFESSKKSLNEYEEQINSLLNHPGRESATGFSSITNSIAFSGGDAKTFLNELKTFQSQAFLSNIDKLRGTGPLSNVEGEKLQVAVGNLDPTSDEGTFLKNLKYVKQKFNDLKTTAEKEASQARADLKREALAPSAPNKKYSGAEIESVALRQKKTVEQVREEMRAKGLL